MLLKFCDYCNKELEFRNHNHWASHRGSCKFNPGLKERLKKTNETKKIQNPISAYTFNCKKCNEEYKLDLKLTQFNKGSYKKCCSYKCANSREQTDEIKLRKSISAKNSEKVKIVGFNKRKENYYKRNIIKIPKIKIKKIKKDKLIKYKKCFYCDKEYINKTSCTKFCSFVCKEQNKIKIYPNRKLKNKYCEICNNTIEKSNRKTCSTKCRFELISKKSTQRVLEIGSNNWKNKREEFNYKNFTLDVDSKLEKAGIIYLADVLKADKIERYRNIINYKFEDKNHYYNPDFYVKEGNKVYIVEVKMKWSSRSINEYNKTIPAKKEALDKFCKDKGYKMIWLDFDYDKELKIIYKQIRKMEVPN